MNFPLVGNGKLRLTVESILKEKHLPHAILIDGEKGTGKHTLALFLSLAAVCTAEEIPCGVCKNCHLAVSSNHPDITFITPESGKKFISVSQIRNLRADAYIKPHIANRKVFIIDHADSLNEQAQNAMLKVLEEPPGDTVFILISEYKSNLLETIISRCAVLTLNSPAFNESFDYISEKANFEPAKIESALKETRNNIGKALNLLNGNQNSKIADSAGEFLKYLISGNEWGMLTTLAPFESSRIEAESLFKEIKYLVASEIKKYPKSVKSVSLYKFYSEMQLLEEQLITNINLPLLFSQMTATAKDCFSAKKYY